MLQGKIVSFDQHKGYGFVALDTGGEDVLVHANDLLSDKSLMVPGSIVQLLVEEGDRGPKASEVNVIQAGPTASASGTRTHRVEWEGDDMCDVLSLAEFEREFSETLLHVEPTLTGAQILDVRKRLLKLAQKHGWVDR